MMASKLMYVGANSKVVAIDQETGETLWQTKLGGFLSAGFVNLFFDKGRLFAHNAGILYSLDPSNGEIRWENGLEGCGYDTATMVSATNPGTNIAGIYEKMEDDRESSNSNNLKH